MKAAARAFSFGKLGLFFVFDKVAKINDPGNCERSQRQASRDFRRPGYKAKGTVQMDILSQECSY